ncbi:MAG: efflux transporter outer membrane subunit [Asticcacaulis sp.]
MRKFLILTSAVAPAFLLAGCLSTPYATPDVPTPSTFAHAGTASTEAPTPSLWWQVFGDDRLSALVDRAIAGNNDLAAAAIRVQQARDQAGLTRLDQFPSVSGGVNAASGSGSQTYRASLSVSYEVDLWGRLANAGKAATWEAQATEQDRQAAQLALAGTVCQLYWDIGYTHQQITTGQASLAYAQKILDLVNIQHQAGAVSGLEVAEAQQSVNSQTSGLASLQQQLVEDRSALGVILGGIPMTEDEEPQTLPANPLPEVRAGLPAELLGRRPDLQAAELRLRESLANVDETRADIYPALSLTASGGGASDELGSVLSNATGSVGAALTLPFLDFPRKNLAIKVSKDQYQANVLSFRTTLLQAMADTDNALSNRTQLAAQGQALADTLENARKVEALNAIQYRAGSIPLRTWLDAQESLRQTQLSVDNNRLQQLLNQSTLYQALGGGI